MVRELLRLLGPASLSKWRTRAVSIARTGALASAAVRLHNTRAAPVTLYLAQLLMPPKDMRRRESFTLHKLLHLPPNVFDYGSLFCLDCIGGPTLTALLPCMLAASLRTAIKICPIWTGLLQLLRVATEEHVSFARALRGDVWSDLWDSAPFAWNLQQASLGFPAYPELRKILQLWIVKHVRAQSGSLAWSSHSKTVRGRNQASLMQVQAP